MLLNVLSKKIFLKSQILRIKDIALYQQSMYNDVHKK